MKTTASNEDNRLNGDPEPTSAAIFPKSKAMSDKAELEADSPSASPTETYERGFEHLGKIKVLEDAKGPREKPWEQ
jgi:hypothetical protein